MPSAPEPQSQPGKWRETVETFFMGRGEQTSGCALIVCALVAAPLAAVCLYVVLVLTNQAVTHFWPAANDYPYILLVILPLVVALCGFVLKLGKQFHAFKYPFVALTVVIWTLLTLIACIFWNTGLD